MRDLRICVAGSGAAKGFGRVQTYALTVRAELGFVPMSVDCFLAGFGWVCARERNKHACFGCRFFERMVAWHIQAHVADDA